MRVPLNQGAYQARSVIANAQRSVNLYAEKNPADSEVPYTHYNVPGLTSLATLSVPAPGRGLYWANSGDLYYVAGSTVYYVTPAWALVPLGTLTTGNGVVSMADNGTTLGLVDGSPNGYQINLTTRAMTKISALTNAPPVGTFAFYGANRVDMLDGYMLFNQPGTRNFYSTYNNEMIFDSLYFAAKNGYSDPLVSVIVTRREIWLIGERTAEIWFNAGLPDFPFQIMPGPFVQHGCIAKYSVAQVDGAVFWLSQDQAGASIIVRAEGYIAKPISTPAMNNTFASYPTVADAQGFCFSMNGHTFYQINFPTANKSWRWDEMTPGLWHEVVWTDTEGRENRHRASCAAWAYGKNVCADWQTGELYAFDLNNVTDAGQPMQFRRGWPHMMKDGQRVIYPGFVLDVEAGTSMDTTDDPGPFPQITSPGGVGGTPSIDAGPVEDGLLVGPGPGGSAAASTNVPATIWLRWSDDRGRTFGNPVAQSLGATGKYLTQPQWNRTGMARDRVFEVFGTIPGKLAINGAFLDPEPIILKS